MAISSNQVSNDYHDYVIKDGKFEEMYRVCADPWPETEDDLNAMPCSVRTAQLIAACKPARVLSVGSFRDGILNLKKRSLDQILRAQVIGRQIPFLGICLGMQMLATKGWEGGETEGLGWIDGEVERLTPDREDMHIPHIGWNEVVYTKKPLLFKEVASGKDFYFVHSYHLCCRNEEDVGARTDYCGGFVSAVARGQIFGVQFHPEKSQRMGFQVLRNFLSL
jgi:glutamine amidotransferase